MFSDLCNGWETENYSAFIIRLHSMYVKLWNNPLVYFTKFSRRTQTLNQIETQRKSIIHIKIKMKNKEYQRIYIKDIVFLVYYKLPANCYFFVLGFLFCVIKMSLMCLMLYLQVDNIPNNKNKKKKKYKNPL